MLAQTGAYLILSIIAVYFSQYLRLGVQYINLCYQYLYNILSPLIMQPWIVNVCILFILPLLLAGIPALIYKLVKHKTMPYFIELIWFLWLVLVLSRFLA